MLTVSEVLLILAAIIVAVVIFLLVEMIVPKHKLHHGAITWFISAILFALVIGLYALLEHTA